MLPWTFRCRCDIVAVVVVVIVCVCGMEGGDENFSRALQEMHVDNSESHIRDTIQPKIFDLV